MDPEIIRPTHAQALETYWRQLELTPHDKLNPGVMGYVGRAWVLQCHARATHGVVVGGALLAMNWSELGVVPVGGQGLTDNERKLCAWAGQAMARLFAEEAANGHAG